MWIAAVSNFGKQVNLQFKNQNALAIATQKCYNWLPAENIFYVN